MEVTVKAGGIDKEPVDAIVLMRYEGDAEPQGTAAMVDKALGGAVLRGDRRGFAGHPNNSRILQTQGVAESQRSSTDRPGENRRN